MPKQPALYTVVDLTGPGSSGWANDVNKERTVVGSEFLCAARWQRAGEQWVEEALTDPPCYPEAGVATEVQAVGVCGSFLGGNAKWLIPVGMAPVIWHDRTWEYLNIPDGLILDINSSDQAVGHREQGAPWGFVWEEGELTYVDQWARAWGISDNGQVVGDLIFEFGGPRPAVWERKDGEWELVRFLPTLPSNPSATAKAVNEVGQIVGISSAALVLQR